MFLFVNIYILFVIGTNINQFHIKDFVLCNFQLVRVDIRLGNFSQNKT